MFLARTRAWRDDAAMAITVMIEWNIAGLTHLTRDERETFAAERAKAKRAVQMPTAHGMLLPDSVGNLMIHNHAIPSLIVVGRERYLDESGDPA